MSAATGWIAITFSTDIHAPLRRNCHNFGDPLAFHNFGNPLVFHNLGNPLAFYVIQSSGQKFSLSKYLIYDQILTKHHFHQPQW